MGSVFKGHIELDGSILQRVLEFTHSGGRTKTKQIPAGSDVAQDTIYGPKTVTGTIVVSGTDEDGFEVDWDGLCDGKTSHTMVHQLSAARRRVFSEVEFSTNDDAIPTGDGEYRMTVNWVGKSRYWD